MPRDPRDPYSDPPDPWNDPASDPGDEDAYELSENPDPDPDPDPAPAARRVSSLDRSIASTAVRCLQCGYDLSGTPIGGACPECGTPVSETFAQAQAGSSQNAYSVSSLVLGIFSIISVVCCSPLSILVGLLAVVFATIARQQNRGGGVDPGGDGMALTGSICGWVGIGLSVLFFLVGFIL